MLQMQLTPSPITATVAVGQAYTASAPMSRLFMARYAPP